MTTSISPSAQAQAATLAALNIDAIRKDFPILSTQVHGLPLIYLDNAATTQKPSTVLDAMDVYYRNTNANVHRGLHALSELATAQMESARKGIAQFINAPDAKQLIFTKGTTDGLNLLATSLTQMMVDAETEIIITHMEHHSNIVPWQIACERTGAKLKVVRIDDRGQLDLDHLNELLSEKTRIVSFVAVSNSLGTVNPAQEIVNLVRQHPKCQSHPVAIIVDGAQSMAHQKIDVQAIDCDFLVFSAHKMFGPTGIGALYGKREWLERMPPYQGGGDMIRVVSFEGSTYAELPYKFEAGTPAIAETIGFGAAIEYLDQFDLKAISAHEHSLVERLTARLSDQAQTRIIGQSPQKSAVVSFYCEEIHPHDLGTLLDFEGVAIRAGHHCTMPVMKRFCVPATVRASVSLYNTLSEVDAFCDALARVRLPFQ
jgi:cysteine desulfurase/selenocysteine lyase